MTKRKPTDIAASVHQRLLNKSKETGRPFSELLQYFAMERFLYRLSKSPHADKFILKGALMFTALELSPGRPTMDIDVEGRFANDPKQAAKLIKEICEQTVEPDGLQFDPGSISAGRIREDAEYQGIRVLFGGKLGNAKIHMQVDIGFGDVVFPKITKIKYPIILDFDAPILRMYTLESTIAEKFEAMVKLDILNSRMKDFYDIWILSKEQEFDGAILLEAVKATFERRQTIMPANPTAFTETFYSDKKKTGSVACLPPKEQFGRCS